MVDSSSAYAVEETASASEAPDMRVHGAQERWLTVEKGEKVRVPGSPRLDVAAGVFHEDGSIPSPLRAGRGSLSSRQARKIGFRLRQTSRTGYLESRGVAERKDRAMGTSPCTAHAFDSLACFSIWALVCTFASVIGRRTSDRDDTSRKSRRTDP